jgi:hypothetical protein
MMVRETHLGAIMFDDDSDLNDYPELKELADVYNEVNYI